MNLFVTDVKKVHFEDTLKAWMVAQMFLPNDQRERYHRITWGARRELKAKIAEFSEGTRQLILRSTLIELIKMVIELDHEKDILYLAKSGNNVDYITLAGDTNIRKAIPILLSKDKELSNYVTARIVKVTEDLYDLYQKSKDKHKEILPAIMDDDRCTPDLFVTLINLVSTDKDVTLGGDIRKRLMQLLADNKIYVMNKPCLVEEKTV